MARLKAQANVQEQLRLAAIEAAVKAAEAEMQKKVSQAFTDGMTYAKTFILESRQMK